MYKHLTKFCFPLCLFFILLFSSCQKEISFEPGRITDQPDSTLLIKSITSVTPAGQDLLVETYSYDTVARKITLTWTDPTSSEVPDGTQAELTYGNNNLISHAEYIYPAGYVPQPFDRTTIDVRYDAENILKNITVHYGDGSVSTKDYLKTSLPSGNFQLSWEETDAGAQGDTVRRAAVFNAAGKNILNVVDHSFIARVDPSGQPVFNDMVTTDTIFYDATGNISKITRLETDSLNHSSQTFVRYNFSRETKGNGLYNQRQLLLNGIAEMPFFDPDSHADLFGMLSFSLENEQWQYSQHPLRSADIHWLGNDYQFTGANQFDSLDRLVRMKVFLVDLGVVSSEIKIEYYK